MIKNKSGVWGEVYTARYLRDNGYKMVASGYYCRFGELDLIAIKDNTLCFVEVKTRDENTAVRPMEAVDESKQKKLELTARHFISYSKLDMKSRFDVSEVYLDKDMKAVKINYIENAF